MNDGIFLNFGLLKSCKILGVSQTNRQRGNGTDQQTASLRQRTESTLKLSAYPRRSC